MTQKDFIKKVTQWKSKKISNTETWHSLFISYNYSTSFKLFMLAERDGVFIFSGETFKTLEEAKNESLKFAKTVLFGFGRLWNDWKEEK